MRQIQIGALFLVISAALAACSGDKFSASQESGSLEGPATSASGGSGNYTSIGGSSTTGSEDSSNGGEADTQNASSRGGAAGSSASAGSGGIGTGGSSASAGSSAGGTSSSGGGYPMPAECATGKVTFKMVPGIDLPKDFLCDAGCGTGWLSITDSVGATAYSLFSACGVASCETCEVQTCVAAACLPTPLTAGGSELTWDGSYFTKDTCGTHLACQKPACVKPGKYKAKACAAINAGSSGQNAGCMPKNEMLCAEAEFEFPGTDAVKLTLQK